METKPQATQVNNSNYFDIQNLDEIAGLEAHISFAEDLIAKYNWDSATKQGFRAQLDDIRAKQQDKLLNLAVVGEFSTGKSTFINAMLRRDDFLVSSALQGTTVATTVIEHAETCSIELIDSQGRHTGKSYANPDVLKKKLIAYTSDPKVAKDLRSVRLRLPSEPLSSGFRIIDTPGTNANEQWHEEVTVRTIREMADMAILIVDANKPLSQSFCDFVKTNLGDMLHNCVFVVTRIDMIRARERDRVLAYLGEKIAAEFGMAAPVVLPYASTEVLDSLATGETTPLAAQSFEAEAQMLRHTTRLKMIAQTQKLISLIGSLYLAVSDQMAVLSDGYRNELDLLLKTQHTDLKPFIDEQVRRTRDVFCTEVQRNRHELTSYLDSLSGQSIKCVMDTVDSFASIDALKEFTTNGLSALCCNEAQTIIGQSATRYSIAHKAFDKAMKAFQRSFEQLFEDLDILSVDFEKKTHIVAPAPPVPPPNIEASNYIADELFKENASVWGGAAAGALVGNAIAPGIGFLIGGAIGFFGGAALSPDTGTVKSNTKSKLATPLRGYFTDVVGTATKGFDDYVIQIQANEIPKEINKYLTTYRQTVAAQIVLEKERIASVERKLSNLRTDMDIISKRKLVLESLNHQLSQMGGKEA